MQAGFPTTVPSTVIYHAPLIKALMLPEIWLIWDITLSLTLCASKYQDKSSIRSVGAAGESKERILKRVK
jgi:hypothetical protein